MIVTKLRSLFVSPRRLLVVVSLLFGSSPAHSLNPEDLSQLLLRRSCESCDLRSADLVHADLRGAHLVGAQLQSSNLSQANLSGARLRGANLRGCILVGASLRGADLSSAHLEGADLRSADLTGAILDERALITTHWRGALGLRSQWLNSVHFHNAAVVEAESKRWPAAEQLFTAAIELADDEPWSWAGRGLSRGFQGKFASASSDFSRAEALLRVRGDFQTAELFNQLKLHALENPEPELTRGGNGLGVAALDGVAQTVKPLSVALQSLAPIALKLLTPLPF